MRKRVFITILFLLGMMGNLQVITAEEAGKSTKKAQINDPEILKEQAIISYKNNNYKGALSYLENLDPNSLDDKTLLLIANCYDHLDNTDQASVYLSKAVKANPSNSYAYYNLGVLSLNSGDTNTAINLFEKSTRYNNKFTAAHYNLGISYYTQKNYKQALKSFLKAFSLDSTNPDICYNVAITYENLNLKEKSAKYFDLYKTMTGKESSK